jgi:hypothetical protein
MLMRPNIQTPDRRVRVGLLFLLIGVVFERVGLLLPGLAESALWDGMVHGVSVVFIGCGLFLGVSGATTLARRH